MAFDFKKEYREFYLPKSKPEIVKVPPAHFVGVTGSGDPNDEDGAYKAAISILYAVSYTIKMSKMGDHRMEGYFDYVVPRSRASGGKTELKEWTIRIRPRSIGPRRFAFQTS